jgi:hypothetical protein
LSRLAVRARGRRDEAPSLQPPASQPPHVYFIYFF